MSELSTTRNTEYNFVFFGTEPLAKHVLDTLKQEGFLPKIIVTSKDALDKKNNTISPIEKIWAKENRIQTIEPEKITKEVIDDISKSEWDFFIVASYGKILPERLLNIPKKGVLNLHPSLLPKLRGPSPVRSAILNDERDTGVSIMLLDKEMDHGPILAQKRVDIPNWPPKGRDLDNTLADEGSKLLLKVLLEWLDNKIEPKEQDHTQKTFCKMFGKQDGLLNLKEDPYKNFLKIQAFDGWPGTFFFYKTKEKDIRVKITDAKFDNGNLIILKVIPEGKKEMNYDDFLRGHESSK